MIYVAGTITHRVSSALLLYKIFRFDYYEGLNMKPQFYQTYNVRLYIAKTQTYITSDVNNIPIKLRLKNHFYV